MAYDNKGRWVPSEDLTWTRTTEAQKQALRTDLSKAGLDWRHAGKYAFRTDAWKGMTEGERFDVLQQYDTWYDKGGQLALQDEAWGLDIERGITYDTAKTWSTQEKFHNLTGGNLVKVYTDKTPAEIIKAGIDKYKNKERGEIIGQVQKDGKTQTLIHRRQYPMDWADYTHDELYRAAIDEVLEKDYDMFMGSGADYDNAKQVRAANKEIQSWVQKHYTKAAEEGKDGAWAEKEWEADKAKQIAQGKIHNQRYPEGRNTRGFQHNQQVMIRKYKPFQKFDEETGTMSRYHPLTGELRSETTYSAPPPPTRMTITGDKTKEDVDAGHYYSPTFGYEDEITDSMMQEPPDIAKPTLSIRKMTARLPDNIKNWKQTGTVK